MGCNCGKKKIVSQPKRVIKSTNHSDDSKRVRKIIRRVAK